MPGVALRLFQGRERLSVALGLGGEVVVRAEAA